jgi:hypothetical protein
MITTGTKRSRLERVNWRFLWWTPEASRRQGEKWGTDIPELRGGVFPAEVLSGGKWVGQMLLWNAEEGWRFYCLPPPSIEASDPDGPNGVFNDVFKDASSVAAVLTAVDRGINPQDLLDQVDALTRLKRPELRTALAARHGWIWHVCGQPIPRRLRVGGYEPKTPDPLFPDIEHVIPLSLGGPHWWPNLRLAHRRCNQRKGSTDDGSLGRDLASFFESIGSDGLLDDPTLD